MATRTTNRQSWPGRSEYMGEVRANTLPAKEAGAPLDAAERMRLIYLTGTEDIEAEPDRRAWLGYSPEPESVIDFKD
jgi:hypothetical protein